MALRIIAGGFIMCVLFAAHLLKPAPVSPPSKLEKTCYHEGAWLPCFIKDEALQTQWNV